MEITYWSESAMVSADLRCLPGNSNTGALAEYLTQGLDSIEKFRAGSVITGFLKLRNPCTCNNVNKKE